MPLLEDLSSENKDQLMSESEREWHVMRREISDELMTEAKGVSDETNHLLHCFTSLQGCTHLTTYYPS